jgi:hypothetical protein
VDILTHNYPPIVPLWESAAAVLNIDLILGYYSWTGQGEREEEEEGGGTKRDHGPSPTEEGEGRRSRLSLTE